MTHEGVASRRGFSRSAVSRIEVGRRAVRSHDFHRLAPLYVRDPRDLLEEEFEANSPPMHSLPTDHTASTKRNVFLSFRREHKALVDLFFGEMTNSQSTLSLYEYFTEMPSGSIWKRDVEGIIRSCTATICMVGDTTHRSEAVNWEIRKSAALGKLVLAFYLQSTSASIPTALFEIGVIPMPRNARAIVEELL